MIKHHHDTAPTKHPVVTTQDSEKSTPLKSIDVNPMEQRLVHLGDFSGPTSPKGVEIELTPDPSPINSIITKVTSFGNPTHFQLYLHIANYGTTLIHANITEI